MNTPENLRPFAFVLAVPDLPSSAAYFRDKLGFEILWPDRLDWQLACRESVRIMLGHCPHSTPPTELGDHSYFAYLHVDDANALYQEWMASGALVSSAPTDREWGMREFLVSTPDGHRLMVGQILA